MRRKKRLNCNKKFKNLSLSRFENKEGVNLRLREVFGATAIGEKCAKNSWFLRGKANVALRDHDLNKTRLILDINQAAHRSLNKIIKERRHS